jgi:flagellar hook-length control protein FliK
LNYRERPPVLSVTSETAANLSLQNAPSRSAKADPTPPPDSFSSLIDNNAAEPASSDRSAAPDRPAPQPRSEATSAASDSRQPRDAASSKSSAAKPASQDSEPATQPVTVEANAGAGAASKPAKPGATKSGIGKTALQESASEIIPAADAATTAPQAATTAPVAVAIAAPVAVTDIVAAPTSPATTTEPLAIAAAAIATSTSTVEASKSAVAPAQRPVTPEKPAAPAVTAAMTPTPAGTPAAAAIAAMSAANVADPAAAPAVTTQAAANDIIASTSVNQPAVKADAAPQADPQLAAVVAAATPVVAVTPKPLPKAPATARAAESAAPVKTGIAPSAADPSVASPSTDAGDTKVAPQTPAADGKPKPDSVPVEAAKAEPAKPDTPLAAAPAPHEHRAATTLVQTDFSDSGQVANAIQQPQAPSASSPMPATQLSVTAATAAAVPLNGLALQIAVSAQSGRSRFEIRLDPAELGRIDIRIDVDRHGQLTSHLTVEKPETLAMLRQDAPQLQRALDNAGFKTGDSGLQFSLRDQSSSGQNGSDETGRNAQRLIISEDDTVPASVAGRTYGRLLGSSSGVDIRV